MPNKERPTQHPLLGDEKLANTEVSEYWSGTMEWLLRLKQLVECEVEFTALKFANYLEAEQQLFRHMPELRAVCLEARRLCSSNPHISPQVAERVGQLQSIWLAIETRLAEFKSERTMLTALSGDLKLLDNRQGIISPKEMGSIKHYCCSEKMAILDSAVHKKEDRLQQMLMVTSAISKILDWFCNNDVLLLPCDHVRPTVLRSKVGPTSLGSKEQWTLSSPSSRTTYRDSLSQTDSQNCEPYSTESSEILAQAGLVSLPRSCNLSRNANFNLTAEKTECDISSFNFDTLDSNKNESFNPSTDYQLSSELCEVDRVISDLTSSTSKIQASLAAAAEAKHDAKDAASQQSQLVVAEATLTNQQIELAHLKNSLLAATEEKPIFQRGYLDSIDILAKLTMSLRDRCRSKLLLMMQDQASNETGSPKTGSRTNTTGQSEEF